MLANDVVLSIGTPLYEFQIPTMVTMTIAATWMHRSLVDFATSDMCAILHITSFPAHSDRCRFSVHQNLQTSGLRFAKTKQIRVTAIPLDPMGASASTVLQQDLTQQMSDHGLSTNTDEEVRQEPNGSTLEA